MDAKKQFSRIGWAYVMFLIVATAATMFLAGGVVMSGLWFIDVNDTGTQLLLSQIAMYGCGFPVFYILMKRIPSWTKVQPERIPAGKFFVCLVFCFGFSYIGSIIGQILMFLVNLITGSGTTNPVEDMVSDIRPWMMLASTVVIAPVMEELMFRKMLIDRIVPFGQRTAVIVSGFSFGLFHGNFYQFFYASILGVIFAYIYSTTGKIRYSIILHMCINFVGGMVPSWLLNVETELLKMAAGLWLMVWMIGCMIAAVVLACLYVRKVEFFPGWQGWEGGAAKKILTAPGVIGFLILCGMMFIWS